jgi:hypothetical protein
MIALVRAVTTRTKEICARALLHLLNDSTIEPMLDEGTLQAFAALCGLESEEALNVCARAFSVLSHHPKGRLKIVSKKAIMQGLYSLVRSSRVDTQKLCGRTVYNLLISPEAQKLATAHGAMAVVKVVCTLRDPRTSVDAANAIAKVSDLPMCREHIIRESIPYALVLLLQENHQQTAVASMRALCCLSATKSMRRGEGEPGPSFDLHFTGADGVWVWLTDSAAGVGRCECRDLPGALGGVCRPHAGGVLPLYVLLLLEQGHPAGAD